jgi:hypothetical protein
MMAAMSDIEQYLLLAWWFVKLAAVVSLVYYGRIAANGFIASVEDKRLKAALLELWEHVHEAVDRLETDVVPALREAASDGKISLQEADELRLAVYESARASMAPRFFELVRDVSIGRGGLLDQMVRQSLRCLRERQDRDSARASAATGKPESSS